MIGGNVSTMLVTWAFSLRRSSISFSRRLMSRSMEAVQARNRTPAAMSAATVSPSGPSSSCGICTRLRGTSDHEVAFGDSVTVPEHPEQVTSAVPAEIGCVLPVTVRPLTPLIFISVEP
jgi:hypothetical protein